MSSLSQIYISTYTLPDRQIYLPEAEEICWVSEKTILAWFQGAFPPGKTCLSGLNLLLGTQKRECRWEQAFFEMLVHKFRFVHGFPLSWWEVG